MSMAAATQRDIGHVNVSHAGIMSPPAWRSAVADDSGNVDAVSVGRGDTGESGPAIGAFRVLDIGLGAPVRSPHDARRDEFEAEFADQSGQFLMAAEGRWGGGLGRGAETPT